MNDSDFYEEDEPLEVIQAIRQREPDFVTGHATVRGVTLYLVPSEATGQWERTTSPMTRGAYACP